MKWTCGPQFFNVRNEFMGWEIGLVHQHLFTFPFGKEKTMWTLKVNFPRATPKNKISFQTNLERNSSNFSYISFLSINFENLTVEFHIPYVLNMYIKFRSNRILFTIWSINLFFICNFKLQKLEIITFIWWHSNWFFIFLKFCK